MLCSEDGLPIARDFNPLLPSDKIGASLSACLKQARESLKNTPYSAVQSMSIELAGHLITVFNHGKLYLVVLHDHGQISGKVCKLVGEILSKLPQTSVAK
ncbi:roadblock/LC7 domain-containing protein [Kamptonema cortianum]|nr:roadblock/LC7 domain-containing protein [Kamptonema cortianum]